MHIPNFYNKTEVGNLISNLKLLNYYTKNQADALISNIGLVDSYAKAEIDSQLTYYKTTSYLQDNCMTSISITETLMNIYASITLLGDGFYGKTYLYNKFSLKADASELTSLVTADYLTTKYTKCRFINILL